MQKKKGMARKGRREKGRKRMENRMREERTEERTSAGAREVNRKEIVCILAEWNISRFGGWVDLN